MTRRPVIEVDVTASQARRRRLHRYVASNLLSDGQFLCPSHDACRASRRDGDDFREGTMSHLGRRFDLTRDGRPLRIVVVGQESGLSKDPSFRRRVDLDLRYHQVHDQAGLKRRYKVDGAHPGRNPHMRGTTSTLRILLGDGPGADFDGEIVHPVNGKPFHLFDGFALVNRLLCSAGPPETSNGRPTPTMFGNCASHFAATLAILEPTLLVVQGTAVAKRVRAQLAPAREHTPHLYETLVGVQRTLVCTFTHPSAHGARPWGDRLDAPYLTGVVTPTLEKALRLHRRDGA